MSIEIILALLLAIGIGLWLNRKPKTLQLKEGPEITIQEENSFADEELLTPKLTETYLNFDNIIGQENAIEYMKGHIKKARQKGTPLKHILLWGFGGLGKSTIIKAIANEMGGRFIEVVPNNLRTAKDLLGRLIGKECPTCGRVNPYSAKKCLSKCEKKIGIEFEPHVLLQENDILFLEECHGLNRDVEEALYSLMQDSYIMVECNGMDRAVHFPPITVAGATTRSGDLNQPFRDRFKIKVQLVPYKIEEMEKIIDDYSSHSDLIVNPEAIKRVAEISHGIPRIAKKYIDDAETRSKTSTITIKEVEETLRLLAIDKYGLDELSRKAMKYILIRMQGAKNGGAGTAAIATAIGITTPIYMEQVEPGLQYQKFIIQGSRGRQLTDKALDIYFKGERSAPIPKEKRKK